MTTVTQWFDGMEKPVREGWYQRKVPSGHAYWYFNDYWRIGGNTVAAGFVGEIESKDQALPWRGLAEKPQEPTK